MIARNNYQPETVVDGESGYLVGSDVELVQPAGRTAGVARTAAEIWRSRPQAQPEIRLGSHRPPLGRSVSGSDVAEGPRPEPHDCRWFHYPGTGHATGSTPCPDLDAVLSVSGDDAQGCFVAEPLVELARLGVANTGPRRAAVLSRRRNRQ